VVMKTVDVSPVEYQTMFECGDDGLGINDIG
jgi:hypothetical protein